MIKETSQGVVGVCGREQNQTVLPTLKLRRSLNVLEKIILACDWNAFHGCCNRVHGIGWNQDTKVAYVCGKNALLVALSIYVRF